VSKDGRYVAYSAVNVLGDADIFLYDRESGQTSNLSRDTHTDSYPVFSHDGKYIAYLSHEKSGRRYDEIMLINRDGSEKVRLTNLLLRISSLSFSPDDRSILFAKHHGDRSSIASLNIATGDIRELMGPLCFNDSPSFDSSGERITYISDCHGSLDVWIMNSDGTGRKPLYKGAGEEHEPHFLKGGESVTFISVSEQTEDGASVSFSLLSVSLEGGEVKSLIPDRYKNRQIFIANLDIPDPQNRIYFQGRMLDSRTSSRYMVFTLDTEKHVLKRTGLRGIDILNPVIR
jgi:Tol biopolymer transport system component